MSKLHFVDQYTKPWWDLRRGIPTASEFHRIITPTGKPAKNETSRNYMYKLIAERLLGETFETRMGGVQWVEHGSQTEAEAIEAFEHDHELTLQKVGFVTTDDGRAGCSPDALVKGSVESVEIKCPAPWTMVGYLLDGLGADYTPQVQGQLLIGGWDVAHFYAYHPRTPPFYRITRRNEPYIADLRTMLHDFCEKLDVETERARDMGLWRMAGEMGIAQEELPWEKEARQ